MMRSLCLFLGIVSFTVLFTSCSDKEDDSIPADPAGTVSLNMMNEDNGWTELGNSDVYINRANNFYSESCLLSSLGKVNGLGSISDILLTGGTNTVAVELGYAFQVFSRDQVKRFSSGKLALLIGSHYYNVFVVSQIKKEDVVVGSNVKFILMDVPNSNHLPELNTNFGTLDYANQSVITIELPTSDFEYEANFNNNLNKFEHRKEGNKLIVSLVEYDMPQQIGFNIRIKDTYTYIYGNVQ